MSQALNGDANNTQGVAQNESEANSSNSKNDKSFKKKAKQNRSSVTNSKPTHIRKVPMATYDSKKFTLQFSRKANVDGESMTTNPIEISLKGLSEGERQLAINVAKIAINYANSHDPTKKPKNGDKVGKSLVDKLISIIKELKDSHAAQTQGAEEQTEPNK